MNKVLIDEVEIDLEEIVFKPCRKKHETYGVFEYNGKIEVDGLEVDGNTHYLIKNGSFLLFISKDKFNGEFELTNHLT